MRQLVRRVWLALAVVLVVALLAVLERSLHRGVAVLIERVGGVRALVLVAIATVLLAGAWLRYGGRRVLRRWGVVITPPRDRRS